jgi:hypothetical protein
VVIEILVFAVLALLTAVALRPLQKTMTTRMSALRDSLIEKAEEASGFVFAYGSASPSIFGTLDFRNITVTEKNGRRMALTVARLRVSYSPLALLKGASAVHTSAVHADTKAKDTLPGNLLSCVRGLRLDKPVFSLALEAGTPSGAAPPKRGEELRALLRDRLAGIRQNAAALSGGLERNLTLSIRRGTLAAGNGDGSVALSGLSFQATLPAGGAPIPALAQKNIRLRGAWTASLSGLAGHSFEGRAEGKLSGVFSPDLENGQLDLKIGAIKTSLFTVKETSFQAILDGERLRLKNELKERYLLSLDYDFTGGRLEAALRADDFSPATLVTLAGETVNTYLALRLEGAAELVLEPDDALSYVIDLRGAYPQKHALRGAVFTLAATGDPRRADIAEAAVTLPEGGKIAGKLGYQGEIDLAALTPINGNLSVSGFRLTEVPAEDALAGDFFVSSEGNKIYLFAESLKAGGVELSAFDTVFTRENADLSFSVSALAFRDVESWENVSISYLQADGSFDYRAPSLDVSLYLETFAVSGLLALAGPFAALPALSPSLQDTAAAVTITTEVFLQTDFTHISYSAPRLITAYGGRNDLFAISSVSGTERNFRLTDGHIASVANAADLAFSADFSDRNYLTFSLETAFQNLAYNIEGVLLDQSQLTLQSDSGFYANIAIGKDGGFSGYTRADSLALPLNDNLALLSADADLRFESASSWSVNFKNLEVSNPPAEVSDTGTPAGASANASASAGATTAGGFSFNQRVSFRLNGTVNQSGALFNQLVVDDGRGALGGLARFTWDADFSSFEGLISLNDSLMRETADVFGTYSGGVLELNAKLANFQAERFLSLPSGSALVSGDLTITMNPDSAWQSSFDISALSFRFMNTDCLVAARGAIDSDTLAIEEAVFQFGTLRTELAALSLDRGGNGMEGQAALAGQAGGRTLEADVSIATEFEGFDSWTDFPAALASFKGTLDVNRMKYDKWLSNEPFRFTFFREGKQMSVSGGPRNMLRFEAGEGGEFYAGFSSPAPLRGSIVGAIKDGAIDARTSSLYIDLDALKNYLPEQDIINFQGGFLVASLRIEGALSDPLFYGTATGNNVRFNVPRYVPAEAGPVQLAIRFDGNEMRFGPVLARVGGGQAAIDGSFRFERWVPNTFSLAISIAPESPIPVATDISLIGARGIASGKLKLDMEDGIFSIMGDILADNTEITMNTQAPVEAPQEGAKTEFNVNLALHTGRKVEVLWPNADWPILRANVDPGNTISIKSESLSGRYSLTGDIGFRGGEIFYFERSFYIRQGQLVFNENETRFDPRLTARAETRDRTENGTVTISMVIDNQPLLSFTPRLESNPPLSQYEILSLMGENLLGGTTAEDGTVERAFVNSLGDVAAQFGVVRRSERLIRDLLHLDMFSMRTQVLQNYFFQATARSAEQEDAAGETGGQGSNPKAPNPAMNFGNYLDNTTVFGGIYIGSDMFVQGMLSMRYDENSIASGGIRFEPDIGIELKNPLFDISWSLVPLHPENLWITDNSITITRRWTLN